MVVGFGGTGSSDHRGLFEGFLKANKNGRPGNDDLFG